MGGITSAHSTIPYNFMFYESTAAFFEADLRDTESSIGNVIYYSLYYVIGIYLKNLTDQANVK